MRGKRYAIGLDFGTNSVRALVVDVSNGREVGTAVWNYEHGEAGVLLSRDPNLARQHPADYVKGTEMSIKKALAQARRAVRGFRPDQVIGIGVATTGSTPIPVDENGRPLAFRKEFARNLAAMAWLWKDHTAVAEAEEITELARRMRPHYLAKYGGVYSSEWFFSKILHCRRTSPEVFDAAYLWVELADWIPAMLTGTEHPDRLIRDARRLDDEDAIPTRDATGIPPRQEDEPFPDQSQIRLTDSLFQLLEHRPLLLPNAIPNLDQTLHHMMEIAVPLLCSERVVQRAI